MSEENKAKARRFYSEVMEKGNLACWMTSSRPISWTTSRHLGRSLGLRE